MGFLADDIYRLVYDNILHDCDNLNENLFSLLMDVGGFLLPGLTGLGHADEAYDLWRYADELPEASRFADDAVRRVDDLADSRRYGDDVAKNLDCPLRNSFSADTSVLTAAGEVAISEIAVGDLVLAYNEATGETGYYTVTAVISHVDPSIVELTIDSDPSASSGTETLETTAEHPFYVVDSAPWLATGETQGRWVNAGELEVGDAIRQADGTTGMVQAVVVVQRRQPMYNLTVADAHTFFVGDGAWLVHNIDCFRNASGTPDSLTPRPGKDDLPGGGLSFWDSLDKLSPGKYVKVASEKLNNLKAVLDNPKTGHISISPSSLDELVEWASTRNTGTVHELTEELINAIIERGVK